MCLLYAVAVDSVGHGLKVKMKANKSKGVKVSGTLNLKLTRFFVVALCFVERWKDFTVAAIWGFDVQQARIRGEGFEFLLKKKI